MAIDPRFKEIGAFEAEQELERQLGQLQENVSASFGNVAEQGLSRLTPTKRQTADYTAKLDELVVAVADIVVTFPVATPKNAGRFIGIEVVDAVVTVRCAQSDVQGDTDEISDDGVYLYLSDGVRWWRMPAVTSVTVGDGLTGGGTGAVDIGLDDDVIVTVAVLNATVEPVRREFERIRVLLTQLVKAELGQELDSGVEGLDA